MYWRSVLDISRFHWFIDHTGRRHEGSARQGRLLTYRAIESGGNNFLVTLVAGIGFFTDSYLLFANNIILPMLGNVYWNKATKNNHETAINSATLAGCLLGMITFGFVGDKYGRRKMYGIELMLLIFGTVGVVMSSTGYTPITPGSNTDSTDLDSGSYGSMNIVTWLIWWRFVSGIGIGGDYPLSAVIVSEFAPTKKRARMLVTVFSMQAFGYATATVVSLIVIVIVRSNHPEPSARSVDQIWRWVMGIGLIPAFAAVFLRLSIPETPRYTLDVLNDPFKAFNETNRFNDTRLQGEYEQQSNLEHVHDFSFPKTEGDAESHISDNDNPLAEPRSTPFDNSNPTKITAREFFINEGNWRSLLGTALAWFLLDFAFYGLGFYSPRNISKIWYIIPTNTPTTPIWDTDSSLPSDDQSASIYDILIQNSFHSIIISSVGAIFGSVALILTINRFNRKRLLYTTFAILGVLFIIIGATYQVTVQTRYHGVTIALYVLCQLTFYFGPNALTFIIPAELFPTHFRCTSHGISAASGKLASVIVQLFLAYVKFGSETGSGTASISSPNSKWLGWVLLIFALPMFLGSFVTCWWIPEVQEKKTGKNLTLEVLAEGKRRVAQPVVRTDEDVGEDLV